MTDKILKNFIRETVIDATQKFRDKRTNDVTQKMSKLANDLPKVFKTQAEQEVYINKRLENLEKQASKMLGIKKFLIACPACFNSDEGWETTTGPFTVISFASNWRNSQDWQQIKQFVKHNHNECLAVIAFIKNEMNSIAEEANKMTWAAPWQRYTKWSTSLIDVSRFIENIEKMSK
jgi:hypothetical protein